MKVLGYAVRRLLLLAPVLLGVTLIAFTLMRVIPGNPVDRTMPEFVPRERIEQIKREMGLMDPLYVQYGRYVVGLLRGDAGRSFVTGSTVASELGRTFPATVELTTYGMLLTILVGVPLGVVAAVKRDSIIDHAVRTIAVAGFAVPLFWLGLILIYVIFFLLNLVPGPLGRIEPLIQPPTHITGLYTVDALLTGNWTALVSSTRMLILPVMTLTASTLAPVARMTRSEMLEALDSDYVRTAKSLGLPQRDVLRGALRNGLLPIVTMIASIYGYLLSGSVLIESIFSWPGMGQYAFQAIANSDYTAVQGYILFVTFMYVSIYLILDIVYYALDPRVQY